MENFKTFFLDASLPFEEAYSKLEKQVNDFCRDLNSRGCVDVQVIPQKDMLTIPVPVKSSGVIGAPQLYTAAVSIHFSYTIIWTVPPEPSALN